MPFDAILVPGGGLRTSGELPAYVKRRFDLALVRQSGEPIVALSGWTSHRPAILDADGRNLFESTAGAQYLIDRGIRPDRIFCESTSYDTIGNAYFSRVQIVGPLGWKRLLVITSEFHMARTEAVFRWIYSLDAAATYELHFAASADDGLSSTALSARRAREEASLDGVQQLQGRLTSLPVFAKWLFTEHQAYQAVRGPMLQDNIDLLETY